MSHNTKGQKTDANYWRVDQFYNPQSDQYEVQTGSNGAKNVQLTGSNAVKAVAVTPSDTVDLADGITKGLYVGGAGNVAVIMADGIAVTFNALQVGTIHPISVKRIKATGTTATNILAVY